MIEKKNIRDSYKFYLETTDVSNKVDIKIFLNIVHGYIKFIMAKVFDGYDVKLSSDNSLGFIGVRGKKITPKFDDKGNIVNLATDWKATYEFWKSKPEAKENKQYIYHLNEHTNSIRYRISWFITGMKVLNKDIYSLSFSKGLHGNRRNLSRLIKEGKEYLVTQ